MSNKRRRSCELVPADEEEFTLETRDASPAHLLIKIKSFSMLWKHGIRRYESSEFVVGECKWKLIIYPFGDESEKEGDHISAYVSMIETAPLPEVNAMFSIFLCNQILDNYLCFRGKVRRFHSLNSKWGFSKLISKKSLTDPANGYLVDDTCVFGAEVFVINIKRVTEIVSFLEDTGLYKHNFVIPQFSKLQGHWSSEEFCVGDCRWKIWLYPNGHQGGDGRSVSFYMVCVDSKSFAPHQKVRAHFCMRIKNKIQAKHRSEIYSHWFTSSAQICGSPNFILVADIRDPDKGFVVDDCCFLEVEMYSPVVARSAHPENSSSIV